GPHDELRLLVLPDRRDDEDLVALDDRVDERRLRDGHHLRVLREQRVEGEATGGEHLRVDVESFRGPEALVERHVCGDRGDGDGHGVGDACPRGCRALGAFRLARAARHKQTDGENEKADPYKRTYTRRAAGGSIHWIS